MALQTKVGSFACPGATGNNAVTGVGFQPVAVLFFCNVMTAAASTGTTDFNMPVTKLGMATGSSNQAVLGSSDDFTGGDPFVDSSHCIFIQGHTEGTQMEASLVSLDADGFTVDFTTISSGALVNYLAIGGSGVSANVVKFTGPASPNTGNFAITGAGFQPTGAIFIGGNLATAVEAGGFGFTDGTNQAANSSNAAASIGQYERTNQCLVIVDGTTKDYEGSIVSLDADGCTIDFTTVPGTGMGMAALFLAGCDVAAGTFNTATSTGSVSLSSLSFQPSALIVSSVAAAPSTTIGTTRIVQHIGMTDGTSQASIFQGDNSAGVANLDQSNVLHLLNDNTTPTDMVVASLTSLDSDGFTLDYTTVDATAREVIFLALGSGTSTPTQDLLPASDITTTGWTPSTGTTLFGVLSDGSDSDWASATLS